MSIHVLTMHLSSQDQIGICLGFLPIVYFRYTTFMVFQKNDRVNFLNHIALLMPSVRYVELVYSQDFSSYVEWWHTTTKSDGRGMCEFKPLAETVGKSIRDKWTQQSFYSSMW